MWCTTSVTEEDKGDYILRITIVDVGKQKENEKDEENTDDCLVNSAPCALAISILFINSQSIFKNL